MDRQFYRIRQFAEKATVSVRTLQYYDNVGLLPPSKYTDSGYRLYSDSDLLKLQNILALKFLGFTLEEIKICLQTGPKILQKRLAQQKTMMREKRAQLDTIILAIEETENLLQTGKCDWESIIKVIQAIQMEQKKEWVNKYFTPEQQKKMEELTDQSYSEEAKQKMAQWGEWTEEDQKRVDRQYAFIGKELKRLVAEGADPASVDAQAIAKLQCELISQFTQNDPDIEAGLKQYWENYNALPYEEKPRIALPWNKEEGEFLSKAVDIYKKKKG